MGFIQCKIWMSTLSWRRPKEDGSVRMKFMLYSIITSISPSMSSQRTCPQVAPLYCLTVRCLETSGKMVITGKIKKMGRQSKKLMNTSGKTVKEAQGQTVFLWTAQLRTLLVIMRSFFWHCLDMEIAEHYSYSQNNNYEDSSCYLPWLVFA